jgi:putative ABC transport system permease protein
MQFDLLMSWNTSSPRIRNYWYQHGSYTFVRLRPGTDPNHLEARFPALAERYKTEEALKDHTWAVDLVPLHDIHLNAAKPHEVEAKGNRGAVHFLLGLGGVVLLMAWTNYVNLATAKAVERAREVGIRKVAGSSRSLLVRQFLFESLLFNASALVLAGGLGWAAVEWLLPYLGLRILPSAFSGLTPYVLPPVLLTIGTILAGLYPALVLAAVAPVAVLKGRNGFAPGGGRLRQGLVVLQFAASLVLIAGTLTVYRQLDYMLGRDPGVQTSQVLVLEAPAKTEDYHRKVESLKGELRSLPGVVAVTGSGAVPGKEVAKFLANRRLHEGPEHDRLYEMLAADFDFIPAYGLQLVAGRNFDRGRPTDVYGLVLNETAARQFGFGTPQAAIGEKVLLEANPGRPNEIIGVIRDYHQQSLEQPYKPTILFMDPDFRWIPADYLSLRINTADVPRLVERVARAWNGFFPESSLDYFFLDEFYDRQYRQDRQFGRTFLAFSALAVGVACLGLLGLTYYSTARRVREIGIRKVLGATALGIAGQLAWDTLKLVGLAIIPGVPVAWYVVRQWLAGYAFRVELHPGYLLLPAVVLTVIALLTVSYLTLRAALTNPADALRNE